MAFTKIHNPQEIVLNKKDAEELFKACSLTNYTLKGNDNMKTPTKQVYETALETVKQYEDRQKLLAQLEKDLSYKLTKFIETKFKINKKSGEVIFSGVNDTTGKIAIGKATCDQKDIFVPVIGKLMAVKKALGEDVEELSELAEPKNLGGFTFNFNNYITTSTI